MFEILIQHAQLCGSNGEGSGNWKESHFFRGKSFHADGTLPEKMFKLYQAGYSDKKCMNGKGRFVDGTPALSQCSSVKYMYDFYPPDVRKELRFIIILREPVSRDWSGFAFGLTHYHHFLAEVDVPILSKSLKDSWDMRKHKNSTIAHLDEVHV